MGQARRIDLPPGCPFKRGKPVQIQFEGRSLEAYDHEPLAMALLAGGVRVFGRSIKYHRPRGPTCLAAHCSGCMMRVDGQPNVRTCETRCRSGMVVERQLGWPGSGRDIFRMMDWIYGRRMDHHGMFTASGVIGRLAQRVVRRFAGFGDPPTADQPEPRPTERLKASVVVIGAGVAGLQASMALAAAGHPVIQLEQSDKIGGHLLDRSCRLAGGQEPARPGWTVREELRARFEQQGEIELHQHTRVVAVYPGESGPLVIATNPSETLAIEAERLVVATGAWGQLPLFENNDLPGVFGLRALDRLVFGWGVVPAEPVLVAGNSDATLRLALELSEAQVALAGLVTDRRDAPEIETLAKRGVELFHDHRILAARGGRWLDRIELSEQRSQEADRVVDCGALAAEAPAAPAYELAHHAGCRVEFSSASGYQVVTDRRGQTSDAHVFAAGHCASARDPDQAWRQGQIAGVACALSIEERPELADRLAELTGD